MRLRLTNDLLCLHLGIKYDGFYDNSFPGVFLPVLGAVSAVRTVPREDGENEEEDQDGASESSGADD